MLGRGTARGEAVITGVDDLRGWEWGGADHQRSWGTNTVTGFYSASGFQRDLMYFEFNEGAGDNEGIASGGDSSGPIFIQDTDGAYKLAGLTYGVSDVRLTQGGTSIGALFDAESFFLPDGTMIPGPGPIPLATFATSVSLNLDLLQPFAPVPEPSALLLTTVAALGTAYRWRRAKVPAA